MEGAGWLGAGVAGGGAGDSYGPGTGDTFSETSSAINWRPWATGNNNGDTTGTRPPDSPCLM